MIPGEADWALAHLLHDLPGGEPGGLAGPGGRHQLHHGGVVGRVARVRHNKLLSVLQQLRDLAWNCKRGVIYSVELIKYNTLIY